MRTYTIGAATLAVAVMAALGACSDGGNILGAGGSAGPGPAAAGASPMGSAGSGVISAAGSGNAPTNGGAPASAGSGATTGGSAGSSTAAGGAAGATSAGAGGASGGATATGGTSAGGAPSSGETGPFKVLIISTTIEFKHDSIPNCQQLVSDLGKLDTDPKNQWTTTIEGDDLADFTATGLKPYRLIFSCNPTGVVFSGNSKVKDKAGAMMAFQKFIEEGGAFAGVHSASDFEKTNGFPWFTNTLEGGYFDRHDNDGTAGSVTPDALNSAHPVLKGLSSAYSTQDEWYYMNRDISAQPGFKILQRLAKDNRPVSWVKDVGMGRMFYTIRGHAKSVYAEKEFKTLVQNGIMWTTKRL